jgi:hypothetical protein
MVGAAILATGLAIAAFLVVRGGDADGDRPAEAPVADTDAGGAEEPDPQSESGPGSNPPSDNGSDRPSEGGSEPLEGERGAGGSQGSPQAPDDEAEPATEAAGGGGQSSPNPNPDHYGPAGEPPSESTSIQEGELPPNQSDPPNHNPDHYGPAGEPPSESTSIQEGELPPNQSDPPNHNPDHG